MKARRFNRARKGFTLVEILIVVVILGILAAVVVPQFTNAADDARSGNIRAQLSTLQNQIELVRARTGAYPTIDQMTAAPTIATANGTSFGFMVDNGYLKDSPSNPANPVAANRQAVAAAASADVGWVYNATTGQISATYFDEATGEITATP
ncbi:MAG: prepilin-type N-terminal cleavage/methylation domain-containing protein [Phycisphaerales bacterium]|nr:MAG: prepilin-type N-terminal cleavage/methylation domain-containing protein [Phycisphaerales bacterium]